MKTHLTLWNHQVEKNWNESFFEHKFKQFQCLEGTIDLGKNNQDKDEQATKNHLAKKNLKHWKYS